MYPHKLCPDCDSPMIAFTPEPYTYYCATCDDYHVIYPTED